MATATSATTLGILTLDAKGRTTTFPLDLRRELGVDESTQLRVVRTADSVIEIVPAQLVDVDQRWYHGDEARARIQAAEEVVLALLKSEPTVGMRVKPIQPDTHYPGNEASPVMGPPS